MSKPAMLARAEAGEVSFFLQMGGQGSPWFRELKKFYDSGDLKEFFEAALSALEEEKPAQVSGIALPQGLDVRRWLTDESAVPSDNYLSAASVSLTMIQMTQLAYFESLLKHGWPIEKLLAHSLGSTGHSQGLISMTFAAMGLRGADFYEGLRSYMKYILYLAIRAQECYPELDPSADDQALADSLQLKDPAPMVAVLGGNHARISEMVEATNAGLDSDRKIYMSLYNSPTNRILSSHRSSLLAFYKQHRDALTADQIKYIFLRTTCPFHSPLMEPAVQPFEADRKKIGFNYQASDLKIPVYSFADGKDYRQLTDMCATMTRDLLVSTLYWEKAVSPIQTLKPAHIIDFGPGKTSQRLTQDTLAGFGLDVPVSALANAKDMKAFIE